MHFADIPFAPHEDSPYNVLLHENPLELTESLIEKRPELIALPPHCTFEEISIKDHKMEILNFINSYWKKDNYRLQMAEDELNYLIESNNALAFVIRYKSLIVAFKTVEMIDVNINGTVYRAGFADKQIIHPKFRKTGLANIFMAMIFREILRHGGKIELFTTYSELNSRYYDKTPLYNIALTKTPLMMNMSSGKHVYEPKKVINKTIREPTIDEMEIYNEIRYKMQLLYTPDMFKAILKYGKAYTDGKSHIMVMFIYDNVDNVTVKTASITNWVNLTKEFLREVIEDLRENGVEIVAIANNGTINDIIFAFDFTKVNEYYQYSINILPKMKKKDIMMNIR